MIREDNMVVIWIVLAVLLCSNITSGDIVNVALNKPASMSSSHGYDSLPAEGAVDGFKKTVFPHIINTAQKKNKAWWWVDLQTDVQDATVLIYFRTDYKNRRNGVELYTSTTPFSSYPGSQLCHTLAGRADGTDIPNVVSVNCTGTWQYLLVYTQTSNDGDGPVLDFGEVEVLGCNGTYGANCDKLCSSRVCAVAPTSCDRYTGACPPGGCKVGYMERDCNQECVNTYGPNCSRSCGHRKCTGHSALSCDHVSGKCDSGCKKGWNGTDCTQECPAGTYGYNCEQLCSIRHCVTSSDTCHHVTGACSDCGCLAGWNGTECMQECTTGTYGANCVQSCSDRHCAMPSSFCDRETGRCPDVCQDGWMGGDCTEKCPEGTFGIRCTSCADRHCEGESDCPADGTCSGGCQDGWRLDNCTQACPSGTYGAGCGSTCGNCTGDDICNHVTGNCPGDCNPGLQGFQCKQTCGSNMYGSSCRENCGHCRGVCNSVNGHCSGGCEEGYNGTRCETMLFSSYSILEVLPAVGGAVAGLLIIVVIIIVCRRTQYPSIPDSKRTMDISQEGRDDKNAYVNVDVVQKDTSDQRTLPPVREKPKRSLRQKPQSEVFIDAEEEILDEADSLSNRDYYNDVGDVIRQVPVGNLEDTVQKIKHRKGGFEAEYCRLPTGFTAPYTDSQKPENAGKNKFRGYYPYDHNRVRLTFLADVPGSDYINASIMHSYDQSKTYIAAQAPNKKTVGDFWRMIWEHRCGRVIMLTGLVENMHVKCYQYWPEDDLLETDHFRVEVEVTDTRANYTMRKMKATSKVTGHFRTIVQYHYTSWPDHGVPDTLALVSFIWMIRRTYTQTDGPLLVHCSAGIGRTGTYVAVDSLLDQARGEGMIDVLGYVSAMRGQRKNMIQTKEQYQCVFQCLVEMTKFGDTSMDVENFTTSYSSRGMDSMVDRKTIREITQMMITEKRDDPPGQHQMWVDGNQDFIVRVGPNLRLLNGYLLTVTPDPGMEKFLWKLVEENNVYNAIIISPLAVDLYGEIGIKQPYGGVSVMTTAQTPLTPDLTQVTLRLQMQVPGSTHNVKLFKFSGTPTMDSMSSLLLDHAHLQRLSAEMSPVVFIHGTPDRKCAVSLCVMGNILCGIMQDRRVDVIGHVRTFLKCCPGINFTKVDVEKLYEFTQKCVEMAKGTTNYANL